MKRHHNIRRSYDYWPMDLIERYYGYVTSCDKYGEPGYDDPKQIILFANWSKVPTHIYEGLKRRGFAL